MAAKRQSLLPPVASAGPKPPVQFSSSLIIAESAILTGSHKIGISSESVIHPRAKLDSKGGPIIIGRRCIIQERTHVGAISAPLSAAAAGISLKQVADSVTLGDYVTVEAGSIIEAGGTVIGDGSVISVGCHIASGAAIGKYCTISARTNIKAGEIIPDYTIIFSDGLRRKDGRDLPDVRHRSQALQTAAMRAMIPTSPLKSQ